LPLSTSVLTNNHAAHHDAASPSFQEPLLDAFSRAVVSADAKTATIGGVELAALRQDVAYGNSA